MVKKMDLQSPFYFMVKSFMIKEAGLREHTVFFKILPNANGLRKH